MLVGAVLRPEQREHRELDAVGIAAEQLRDPLVLGAGEPELQRLSPHVLSFACGHAGCGCFAHAAAAWVAPASARNRASPSSDPVSGSTACSGWGIRPSTLPASFMTPAMSRTLPFGFSPGA